MLPLYREPECPRDPILGWKIGILGYGNQGRAHALNLRDSGCEVTVLAEADRPSAERAARDGFTVTAPQEAGPSVDLLAVLAPDENHRALIERLRAACSASASPRVKAILFAHGFALVFDEPTWDPRWDVVVVAPAGPGAQLRSSYEEGAGIPALCAVHRDVSGQAAARARAYGAAIGCARAGLLETTVRDEVEVDLFGEQSVLCGGMNALTRAAFETLVDAGYPEEMAYLECVQQLRLTAELLESFGVEGMRRRISGTARFGDLTRGPRVIGEPSRAAMAEILGEIRDGRFAREWLAARAAALPPSSSSDRMEHAGTTIRRLFESAEGGTEKHH